MNFTATAEHTSGASVGHPCTRGVYSDPTDMWQEEIEADGLSEANEKAHAALSKIVEEYDPCNCQRKEQPGSNRWWASVSISLWPTDEAAMAAWRDDGGDDGYDPYSLIPAELKRSAEEQE